MRRVARCQGCHERGRQLRGPYIISEIQVLLPSKGKGHDWTNDDGIGKRFPRRIKHPLDVTVQGPHHADPREHGWPAMFRDQQQRLHCGKPFLGIVFCLGQFGDELAGVLQRDELASARQRYRVVKRTAITTSRATPESLTSDAPRGRSANLATVAP
jgi:hypothetical protein